MEYKVASERGLETFTAVVQKLIEDGWTLQGGVAVTDGGRTFFQAMTRKKK